MIKLVKTEKYGKEELDNDHTIKVIIRSGVGVDNVDLEACKDRGVQVINIPDIPCNAVAEFTIGQILHALRYNKKYSRELIDCTIGVFGHGNIGSLVIKKIKAFSPYRILVNDVDLKKPSNATKKEILSTSDIITIHIPLKEPVITPSYNNLNFITKEDLDLMKEDAIIVNMSRGGIINEDDLYNWLTEHPRGTAVLDVFVEEPYIGKLNNLSNVIISHHQAGTTMRVNDEITKREIEIIELYSNNKQIPNRII